MWDSKIFKQGIKWKYDVESNKISVYSSGNPYILQITIAFENMTGLEKYIRSFQISMVANHLLKEAGIKYNLLMTNTFIEAY